ncbi:MAG: NifU family protein [Actinomycetota bacterium]
MLDKNDFQKRMQKIEILTQEVEALPDENARSKAIELMQLMMEYHGAAIERVMEIIAAQSSSDYIFDNLTKDELSNSLLLLYGLHPLALETRIEQALDKVRPFLKSQGGDAELINIENGVVNLQMLGSCNGCPSSSLPLKQAVEKAIYETAPDVAAIEMKSGEAAPKPKKFVQIKGIQSHPPQHQTSAATKMY